MTSSWINHVKAFATKHKMSYRDALKDPKCKSSYKKNTDGKGLRAIARKMHGKGMKGGKVPLNSKIPDPISLELGRAMTQQELRNAERQRRQREEQAQMQRMRERNLRIERQRQTNERNNMGQEDTRGQQSMLDLLNSYGIQGRSIKGGSLTKQTVRNIANKLLDDINNLLVGYNNSVSNIPLENDYDDSDYDFGNIQLYRTFGHEMIVNQIPSANKSDLMILLEDIGEVARSLRNILTAMDPDEQMTDREDIDDDDDDIEGNGIVEQIKYGAISVGGLFLLVLLYAAIKSSFRRDGQVAPDYLPNLQNLLENGDGNTVTNTDVSSQRSISTLEEKADEIVNNFDEEANNNFIVNAVERLSNSDSYSEDSSWSISSDGSIRQAENV